MDTRAFEDCLDRFGGDLAHWPPDLRADADAVLAHSPAARALKREMEVVEACLRGGTDAAMAGAAVSDAAISDAAMPDATMPGLAGPSGNMAAVAMRQRQARYIPPTARRAAWGAAVAAALLLGVLVGNTQSRGFDESPDQVVAVALGSGANLDVD